VLQERRIALKFAYDGSKFFGFQRQPAKLTVEGSLVKALERVDAIKSPRECGYRSSSRTDRGVSSLGNIISFRTRFEPKEVCSAINSKMEDIWAYSAVEVPEDFNPRAARQRWYRYYLARKGQDLPLMRQLAARFVGVHDFSGYARRDKRNPMRKIDSIEVSDHHGLFYAVDFKAESFLWNMVRRIVWMIDEGSRGRMSLDAIGPSSVKSPVRVGLSPPEYLVLMNIDCGIDFPVDKRAFTWVVRDVERRIRQEAMRLEFVEEITRLIS